MSTMNLPDVVKRLIDAQNNHDSIAFAECFSEKAEVIDEGHAYSGKNEIKQWIEVANAKYKTSMTPVNYSGEDAKSVLTAEISGTFDGSPVLLDYHFGIQCGKINDLEITVNAVPQA